MGIGGIQIGDRCLDRPACRSHTPTLTVFCRTEDPPLAPNKEGVTRTVDDRSQVGQFWRQRLADFTPGLGLSIGLQQTGIKFHGGGQQVVWRGSRVDDGKQFSDIAWPGLPGLAAVRAAEQAVAEAKTSIDRLSVWRKGQHIDGTGASLRC